MMNAKLLKWNKNVKIIAPNMGQHWKMLNEPLDAFCFLAASAHVNSHKILSQYLDVDMLFAQAALVISALHIVQIAERILPNELDLHLKSAFEKILRTLLNSLPRKDKSNLFSIVLHQSINL
jgi:hypothetical protein